jgi:putative ABC transport system permease protein
MSLTVLNEVMIQGLIYSLVALGMYITQRVIRVDDLACEGAFASGGAVFATAVSMGFFPPVAIPLALFAGIGIGALSCFLHCKLNVPMLIAGLAVTCGLFSLNLGMAGANLSLPHGSIGLFGLTLHLTPALPLIVLCGFSLLGVHWLLTTEIGLLLRAAGDNPNLLYALGKRHEHYKMVGLMIANGFSALSGALFIWYLGFFSITGSIGTLLVGLASLTLASFWPKSILFGIPIGCILYQLIFALTIEMGVSPIWNNLLKASILVLLIYAQNGARREVATCST